MGRPRKVEQITLIEDEDDALEGGGEGQEEAERQRRTQAIDIKGLPEGVRALLRLKPWRDHKEYSAYIYQRVPDPAKPGRIAKRYLDRVFNTEVEEAYLKQRWPRGGRFSVMYQVPHPKLPGDVQIHTDDFEIEPDVSGALLAPSAGTPSAVHPAGGDSFGSQIANLRALVECVQLLQGNQPAQAVATPAWYDKIMQEKIRNLSEMEDKMQRKLAAPAVTVHEREPEDEAAGWPEFLKPFVPAIKQYGIQTLQALAGKLMGGGLEGAGLRWMVMKSPTFLALWQDPVKREAAAAALISSLGDVGENLVRMIAEEMAKVGQS